MLLSLGDDLLIGCMQFVFQLLHNLLERYDSLLKLEPLLLLALEFGLHLGSHNAHSLPLFVHVKFQFS